MADTRYPRTPKVNTYVICYITIPSRVSLLCNYMALRSQVNAFSFTRLPVCLPLSLLLCGLCARTECMPASVSPMNQLLPEYLPSHLYTSEQSMSNLSMNPHIFCSLLTSCYLPFIVYRCPRLSLTYTIQKYLQMT